MLGRLRHRTFYSLAEVNAAIGELLTHLNEERPIRRLGVTRRQLLEQIDRPALKSLPAEPYEFSEWRSCRVGIDYHVEVAAHYYSVPYRFARAEVDARLTARTVEILHRGGAAVSRQNHPELSRTADLWASGLASEISGMCSQRNPAATARLLISL